MCRILRVNFRRNFGKKECKSCSLVNHETLDAHVGPLKVSDEADLVVAPSFVQLAMVGVFAARQLDGDLKTVGVEVAENEQMTKSIPIGREPWSSVCWRRLMFIRSWVRISATYTRWTFFPTYLL